MSCGDPEVVEALQPVARPVPSGGNLGHHLQVVDSKRLKIATHTVDRTAGPLASNRGGVGDAACVEYSPVIARHKATARYLWVGDADRHDHPRLTLAT